MSSLSKESRASAASTPVTLPDICRMAAVFFRLGCLSFGGPVAHLGYLRAEFVTKRNWLDDAHYGDLLALCQFLPGPASSQMVFALGKLRAGLLGAITASVCFTLPAACLMTGFAYAASLLSDLASAGWLHGLKLSAVAVVAQAVWGMGKKLCVDRARATVCICAASTILFFSGALVQLGVIVCGALIGLWLYRNQTLTASPTTPPDDGSARLWAWGAFGVYGSLLAALPVLAWLTDSKAVDLFDSFYRSGALVFGGGHVVLPLLREEIVPRGWLTDDQFLAGYGAVQAIPGPMFTFSAYLGTAIGTQSNAPSWVAGLWCLFAIFLPAWLLIAGALPIWDTLRSRNWARSALAGANASVVGVLLAALYNPVFLESVHDRQDMVTVLIAFVLLEHWKVSPLWVVLLASIGGQWGAGGT
jgi:chromate transporter